MEVAASRPQRIPDRLVARLPVPPALLLVITAGGMIGSFIRYGLGTAFPVAPGAWPWTTFWINLAGAFLLGGLLEALAATGPDEGWRRLVRLGAGTGLLGGFTTYSTFSVEVVSLLRGGAALLAVGYALLSVVLGIGVAYGAARVTRALFRPGRSGPGGGR